MVDRERIVGLPLMCVLGIYMTLCYKEVGVAHTMIQHVLQDPHKKALVPDVTVPLQFMGCVIAITLGLMLITIILVMYGMITYDIVTLDVRAAIEILENILVILTATSTFLFYITFWMMAFFNKFEMYFRIDLEFKKYQYPSKIGGIVNQMQRELKCCGSEDFVNWNFLGVDGAILDSTSEEVQIGKYGFVNKTQEIYPRSEEEIKYLESKMEAEGSPFELINILGCKYTLKNYKSKSELEVLIIIFSVIFFQVIFLRLMNVFIDET